MYSAYHSLFILTMCIINIFKNILLSFLTNKKIITQTKWSTLFGGGGWIREPRTEKQSAGLFFPACGRDVLFSSHPPGPQTKNPLSGDDSGFLFGGGGWIRTTEARSSRFTVCPLWPLGNSSVFSCSTLSTALWSW